MCDADAAALARAASERWRIPVEIVQEDPSDHAAWLAAATRAVGRVLGGFHRKGDIVHPNLWNPSGGDANRLERGTEDARHRDGDRRHG